ncbi:Fe-S cluster assembly protein SufD [Candidatus Liberibacter solanacearum]|uniref:Fe-S cluster assembly protein SufD n=1 Tax=Candidatus Liberibacter solanacearum TaxID=556287 RepID=A0A1V2N9D0_9HYPH|nr:Fe-S cluster assembly protein SufD [Candidatus Liberibacter solanacearum]ONI58665.1 Fe-S cluster assembly protein SufD [Candidatus Liberibacter solanacearum]ONI60273.1 Fe-S cluster assembly protein SufD [Candidatus Liberibacter solanacearum]
MGNITTVETMLLQACEKVCEEYFRNQSVSAFRKRLLCDFRDQGLLPTKKIENWHYTDLKNLLKIFPVNTDESSLIKEECECLVAESIKLSIGSPQPLLSALQEKGIKVFPFSYIEDKDEKSLCLELIDEHDAIGYINGILVQDGYKVVIPDECQLDVPLELQSVQRGEQRHLRYPISFGVNSKATIIERYTSLTNQPSLVSSIADIKVGKGADITWIIVLDQDVEDTHLGQLRVVLEQNALLKVFFINMGQGLSRRELSIDVEGEESRFMLRGINLLKGQTHGDLSMFLRHKVPNTSSTSIVRSIVLEKSTGVFQGAVYVSPESQGTNATMASNTLLFSNEGNFFVKPELEIFADDVQCGHGATVSNINQDHLYYLMTRNIPKNKAYSMLSHAFISEVISDLNDEVLQLSIEKLLSSWMDKNNKLYSTI